MLGPRLTRPPLVQGASTSTTTGTLSEERASRRRTSPTTPGPRAPSPRPATAALRRYSTPPQLSASARRGRSYYSKTKIMVEELLKAYSSALVPGARSPAPSAARCRGGMQRRGCVGWRASPGLGGLRQPRPAVEAAATALPVRLRCCLCRSSACGCPSRTASANETLCTRSRATTGCVGAWRAAQRRVAGGPHPWPAPARACASLVLTWHC